MEEQVTRRRDSVARPSADLTKRMQVRRTGRAKQAVPRLGPEPHDAGKSSFNIAEFHGAQYGGKICAERPYSRATVGTRIYGHDHEDCGARERCVYRLRDAARALRRFWFTNQI